jgi:hypothetical protein
VTSVQDRESSMFDAAWSGCYDDYAGWSSLVARWAHNPKVGGSNPPPATKIIQRFQWLERMRRSGRFAELQLS